VTSFKFSIHLSLIFSPSCALAFLRDRDKLLDDLEKSGNASYSVKTAPLETLTFQVVLSFCPGYFE